MNRWQCQDCNVTATGIGSPVGLRALGWSVEFGPAGYHVEIRCPAHHPNGSESVETAQALSWLIRKL